MFDNLIKPREGCPIHQRPEGNMRFRNIEEYLSSLKKSFVLLPENINVLQKKDIDWKEELVNKLERESDFTDYLQCLDYWIENESDYDFSQFRKTIEKIQSKEDFYNALDKIYSELPFHSYDIAGKRIVLSDYKLDRISKSITGLNMYKVWEIRKHISEAVWKYLMYACQKVYSRAIYSKCYEMWTEMSLDYYFDMLDDPSCSEDEEYNKDSLNDMERLHEMIGLLPQKKPRLKRNKLTELEAKIIDCADRIIKFDPLDIMPLLNADDYRDMGWDDDDKELWNTHLDESPQCIIDEFFNGQFVLVYSHKDSSVDILESYVEQVNMYENEGQWLVEFDNSIEITKEHMDIGQLETRNKLVDYHNAFYELDELMTC